MSRTSTVLLLTDDYADRLNDLWSRAQEAERRDEKSAASRRMGDTAEYPALRAAYDALKAEAEAAATKVTLRALNRREWRALKEKHPPRAGDGVPEDDAKADRQAGVNVDAAADDLVYAALLEPEFTSRGAYDEWADERSEAEFQTLLTRAWSLVNVAAVDPKSLPGSPTRSSGAS